MATNEPDPKRNCQFLLFFLGVLALAFIGALMILLDRDDNTVTAEHATAVMQMHFAAAASTGLVIVFLIAMGMRFFASGDQAAATKEILDACKTILPPIVSLIFGYYFGQSTAENAAPVGQGGSAGATMTQTPAPSNAQGGAAGEPQTPAP